jgi:sporulation protein YlmC with PRC-barrel domain
MLPIVIEENMRTNFEELRQRPVVDANGCVIGAVDKLIFDTDDWQVKALRIRLRRSVGAAIGARRSFFRAGSIDVPSDKIQSVGDTVLLRIGAHALVPARRPNEARHH